MKQFFKKLKTSEPRPYWHVDAKWVCAMLLLVTLVCTLPVAAAYKLTAKGPATDMIAYTFAGMTSPQGIDSSAGLDEIKTRIAQKGSETVTIAGIDVVFTAKDFNELSPRELRLKVFRTFAERFYDQGARGFAESRGLDKQTIEKFEKDASLIGIFSAEAHKRVGNILRWMIVVDVLLLAAVVFFSWRFGRLVSPGLVFVLAGLPGLLFAAIASQNPEVAGAARSENPSDQMQMIGLFASFVAPLIVPYFAKVYLFSLIGGVSLLAVGGVGKIIYTVRHRKNGKVKQSERDEGESNVNESANPK